MASLLAHLACRHSAAAEAGAGVELGDLAARWTDRLAALAMRAQHVARLDMVVRHGAGIAAPQQNLLRRKAEMLGKRLEVIEPHPDLAALEPRQLLLGNARQPHQFRAAHVARLARVIEPGELSAGANLSCHGPIVTNSVQKA